MSRKRPEIGSVEWYAHWLAANWNISPKGTVWINIRAHNVAIIQDHYEDEKWRYRIKAPDHHETWSDLKYDSVEKAKRPALERLETMLSG